MREPYQLHLTHGSFANTHTIHARSQRPPPCSWRRGEGGSEWSHGMLTVRRHAHPEQTHRALTRSMPPIPFDSDPRIDSLTTPRIIHTRQASSQPLDAPWTLAVIPLRPPLPLSHRIGTHSSPVHRLPACALQMSHLDPMGSLLSAIYPSLTLRSPSPRLSPLPLSHRTAVSSW